MPTTPNCPATSTAPVASAGVSAEAPSRKSGRRRTPPLIVSAAMNAAVAVRKSSPTRAAVLRVEAVVGPPGGAGPVGGVLGMDVVGTGGMSRVDMSVPCAASGPPADDEVPDGTGRRLTWRRRPCRGRGRRSCDRMAAGVSLQRVGPVDRPVSPCPASTSSGARSGRAAFSEIMSGTSFWPTNGESNGGPQRPVEASEPPPAGLRPDDDERPARGQRAPQMGERAVPADVEDRRRSGARRR